MVDIDIRNVRNILYVICLESQDKRIFHPKIEWRVHMIYVGTSILIHITIYKCILGITYIFYYTLEFWVLFC